MILVGPSLGAAAAIDFTVNHPEAVSMFLLCSHLTIKSSVLICLEKKKLMSFSMFLICELVKNEFRNLCI